MKITPKHSAGGFTPTQCRRIWLTALVASLVFFGETVRGAEGGTTKPESKPSFKAAEERARQRLEWNRKTLAGAYDQVGKRDSSWDDAARQALEAMAKYRTARDENTAALQKEIADASHQATQAGCKDPLLAYLHLRYRASSGVAADKLAGQYRAVADRLLASEYPAVRKFFANVRTAGQIKAAQPSNAATPPEVDFYRRAALTNLLAMLEDATTPVGEVTDACIDLLKVVETNPKQYEEFYLAMQKPLFQNWSKEGGPYLVKGAFYIKHAWNARGGGYANTVTEQAWQRFGERLKIAHQALERAWELDPSDKRICYNGITVQLGLGEDREDMEKWFERGMRLDPNYYELCRHKLYYLEPKWHGEPEDLLEFGRECVQAEDWGGRVPLILVDAYQTLNGYLDRSRQSELWKSPKVWQDLQSAYEKYFKLNPTATATRNNYAMYAYRCGQWDEFLKQIELVGKAVNYSVFGGQAQFEDMVRNAKDQAARKAKRESY